MFTGTSIECIHDGPFPHAPCTSDMVYLPGVYAPFRWIRLQNLTGGQLHDLLKCDHIDVGTPRQLHE